MRMCETAGCERLYGHSGEHASWGLNTWKPLRFPVAAPPVTERRAYRDLPSLLRRSLRFDHGMLPEDARTAADLIMKRLADARLVVTDVDGNVLGAKGGE